LALKVVFDKLLPVPKLCKKKFLAQCASMMTGTVFRAKKLLFVMQNFGIWGLTGTGGKNLSSKVPSPTLICLFTMQRLWGYDDD